MKYKDFLNESNNTELKIYKSTTSTNPKDIKNFLKSFRNITGSYDDVVVNTILEFPREKIQIGIRIDNTFVCMINNLPVSSTIGTVSSDGDWTALDMKLMNDKFIAIVIKDWKSLQNADHNPY